MFWLKQTCHKIIEYLVNTMIFLTKFYKNIYLVHIYYINYLRKVQHNKSYISGLNSFFFLL